MVCFIGMMIAKLVKNIILSIRVKLLQISYKSLSAHDFLAVH